MPRNLRATCAGCDKTIDGSAIFRCSNGLFRLFLSARALKKIEPSDPACRRCRSKFDNWVKKTKGDFDGMIDRNDLVSLMVRILLRYLQSLIRIICIEDDEVQEKSIQTVTGKSTVEIPIKRTSASHRFVGHMLSLMTLSILLFEGHASYARGKKTVLVKYYQKNNKNGVCEEGHCCSGWQPLL